MIASLPMYWRAENALLWRAFWERVQGAALASGHVLPDLTPPDDLPTPWTTHWTDPRLALSMTCGLPFRTSLRDRVSYVGTLDFGLHAPPGHYHSLAIARPGLTVTEGLTLAYNAPDSQSGWAVTKAAAPFARPLKFAATLATGSHAAALAAVAEGRADIAYVDAITWRLLERFDPLSREVAVLGRSAPTPGLPLVTARGRDPEPLRRALAQAVRDFAPKDAGLMGGPMTFHVLDIARYLEMPVPAPPG